MSITVLSTYVYVCHISTMSTEVRKGIRSLVIDIIYSRELPFGYWESNLDGSTKEQPMLLTIELSVQSLTEWLG